jgi:hypothetical protein
MAYQAQSKSEHVFALVQELLDDIELSRLGPEALLLKASRLARLAGTDEDQTWLEYELTGYRPGDSVAEKYLELTGRWVDKKEGRAYWGPLAQQEASIGASKLMLQSLSTQGIGGDGVITATRNITASANSHSTQIATLGGIRSRVLGLLHKFASRVYYEKLLSQASASIFERHQLSVDQRLAAAAGEALAKIPAVYDRLVEGDVEAISQAMNTCRRIIDVFADSVFPAQSEPFAIGDQPLKVGPEHHQNRINAFIASRTESKARRTRLRQSLANIYDRVCAGIHDDITPQEAQSLVLSTYLLLGEILSLP